MNTKALNTIANFSEDKPETKSEIIRDFEKKKLILDFSNFGLEFICNCKLANHFIF